MPADVGGGLYTDAYCSIPSFLKNILFRLRALSNSRSTAWGGFRLRKEAHGPASAKTEFVADSPLEGDGFELPVPRAMQAPLQAKIAGFGCIPA
jgi:hypothetical protein